MYVHCFPVKWLCVTTHNIHVPQPSSRISSFSYYYQNPISKNQLIEPHIEPHTPPPRNVFKRYLYSRFYYFAIYLKLGMGSHLGFQIALLGLQIFIFLLNFDFLCGNPDFPHGIKIALLGLCSLDF